MLSAQILLQCGCNLNLEMRRNGAIWIDADSLEISIVSCNVDQRCYQQEGRWIDEMAEASKYREFFSPSQPVVTDTGAPYLGRKSIGFRQINGVHAYWGSTDRIIDLATRWSSNQPLSLAVCINPNPVRADDNHRNKFQRKKRQR